MPSIDVRIDFKKTKLGVLAEKGLTPEGIRSILTKCGARLVTSTQARFRKQEFDGKAWPPRRVPNVAGVLKDLAGGGNPKERRFQPRPAVMDTGRLKRSMNFVFDTDSSVRVGTTVPYASKQQYGGKEKVAMTKAMKDRLWKWLVRNPGKEMGLAKLLRKRVVTVGNVGRKFIGIDAQDQLDVVWIVRQEVLKMARDA